MDKVKPYLLKLKEEYNEECDRAVITLAETVLPDLDRDKPEQSMQQLNELGFNIKVFRLPKEPLKTYVLLHSGKDYIAGSVVELNFELMALKRDNLPHFNDLDEPFTKFIEGVLN